MNRKHCSYCGSVETEFIQFADGSEETTLTTDEECGRPLENILTLDEQRVVL